MDKTSNFKSLEDYRAAEAELHTELMHVTRKYITRLGIVSLMGVLDIVKQEIRELEKATRKEIEVEEPKEKNVETKEADFF